MRQLFMKSQSIRFQTFIYVRTAFRHSPEFSSGISKMPSPIEENRFRRMIDPDAAVASNYTRMMGLLVERMKGANSPLVAIGQHLQGLHWHLSSLPIPKNIKN
jgi:hypothetical protein